MGSSNPHLRQSFSLAEGGDRVLTLANISVGALMIGCLVVAVYCKRSLTREARGLEIHAHSDGTVHEHHRGGVPHAHPRLSDRHASRLSRLFKEPTRAEN
jgi:hypothetical protein